MPQDNSIIQGASLISAQNRVESPFIILKIGDYTIGNCSSTAQSNRLRQSFKVTFPNFMKSIHITKINGALNTYTIELEYGITQIDDPNLLEKVFSSVSNSRKVTISYGDWNMPNYIYKNEEAIITSLSTSVSFRESKINYTLKCTSTALSLQSEIMSFSSWNKKPSDVIKIMLKKNGLNKIFTGMTSDIAVSKLIAGDDKQVYIPAKAQTNALDYLSYLVKYMSSSSDNGDNLNQSTYYWCIYDDINNEYGGPYFKVSRVQADPTSLKSYDTYEVDVGYPGGNYVTEFSIKNNDSWSILYGYSQKVNLPEYSYSIDNMGNLVSNYSPAITNSNKYFKTTEADRNWWSQVTKFPIQATLTIKGLLRPTTLMSYLKINSLFYGHRHISSGIYIITKQEDSISSSGYKTTLSLTRISGDDILK